MGCGALRNYRTTKTCIVDIAGVTDGGRESGSQVTSSTGTPSLERQRTHDSAWSSGSRGSGGMRDAQCDTENSDVDDAESRDGLASLSPPPSVHSEMHSERESNASSKRFHSMKKCASLGDDLRSDVPTIAESIADMQDFQDLGIATSRSLTSNLSHDMAGIRTSQDSSVGASSTESPVMERQRSFPGLERFPNGKAVNERNRERNSTLSGCSDDGVPYFTHSISMPQLTSPRDGSLARVSGFSVLGGSQSVIIDSRQHPLSVSFVMDNQSNRGDNQSCNPNVGDIGVCSDVPSIRDDQSVTSAPSEICVSFPPSVYPSENGTRTPPTNTSSKRSLRLQRGSKGTQNSVPSTSSSFHSKEPRSFSKEKESPLLSLVCAAGCETQSSLEPCGSGPGSEAAETSAEGHSPRSLTPSSSVAAAGAPSTRSPNPYIVRADYLSPVDDEF